MFDLLKRLALALLPVPSRGESEPDSIFQWRQAVALSLLLLGGTQLIFIAFALGLLAFMNQPGFAMATDVQSLLRQSQDLRVAQVERAIKDDRTLQCQAMMEGNRVSMDYSYQHLQQDVDAYFTAASRLPRIPDCSELIPESTPTAVKPPTPTPNVPAAK